MASLNIWFTIMLGVAALADSMRIPASGTCEYNGSKCPVYHVIDSGEGYELRHYEPASWISTTATVRAYTGNVSRILYYRLRDYIQRNNARNESVEMTVPVLTERGNPDVNGLTTYTKHLFLTDSNAPEPNADNVFKYYRPAFQVYVRTYGGRPSYKDKEAELVNLKTRLADTSLYNPNKAYFAGYNPPWVLLNRRNEVWVEAITPVQ